jgi:hypothetical protein
MKVICLVSWCPVRAAAGSASEMVSSLLFGETAEVIKSEDDWYHIRCDHDEYEGWVAKNIVQRATESQLLWDSRLTVHGAVWQNIDARIDLSPGSLLPTDGVIDLYGHHFRYSDPRSFAPESLDPVGLAGLYKYTPYLWGGRSVWGIDCSGLIQVIHLVNGVKLPRDASQQINHGREILFGEHQSGDLAFFETNGKITHVGILADTDKIIHASGRVRTDDFVKEGIRNVETDLLTHHLHSIKRLS